MLIRDSSIQYILCIHEYTNFSKCGELSAPSSGSQTTFTSGVGRRYRDTGIQGYSDVGVQGYRDTGIQEYRDTGIQGYMDTEI